MWYGLILLNIISLRQEYRGLRYEKRKRMFAPAAHFARRDIAGINRMPAVV
jgi:hypothetical protein